MRLPRAVLFDLDDTILDFEVLADAAWRETAALAAKRVPAFDEALFLRRIHAQRDAFWVDPALAERGRLDLPWARRQVIGGALDGLPPNAAQEIERIGADYDRLRTQSLRLCPGALDVLDRLTGEGVRLGLVTNGAAEVQRAKIERFALARYFAVIHVEGEKGYGKPNPAAFTDTLAGLRCEAKEAWMVGDRLEMDIAPAVALGMQGIWVDWAQQGIPDGAPTRPSRTIKGIAELLA